MIYLPIRTFLVILNISIDEGAFSWLLIHLSEMSVRRAMLTLIDTKAK